MDSAETFSSSFKFDGNAVEFIDDLFKKLDALESKLSQGVSKGMNRAMDSMDAFAASCLDANTDAGALFHKLDQADKLAREMDELAESAKPVPKSLEEIAREAKELDRSFDSLTGSVDPAMKNIANESDNAKNHVESLDRKIDTLKDSFGKIRNMGLAVGAGISAAAYGVWRSLDKGTEMLDGLDESAQAAGTTATALGQLQYAAKKGGSSAEELSIALKTVSVNAASGDKAFDMLRINVRDSSGQLKKSDALFLEVGNKLQGMKDRTQAAAIATNLFGHSGSQMLSVFGSAPGTIEATMKEAEKLGLVFSDADIKNASDFQDSIQKVGVSFQLMSMKLLSGSGPKVQQFMEDLTKKITKFADSSEGKKFADGIGRFVDFLERGFESGSKLLPVLIDIASNIMDVVEPIADLASKLSESETAVRLLSDAMLLAFGAMALSRVASFGKALWEVARAARAAATSQSVGGTGGAGKMGKLGKSLPVIGTALVAWELMDEYDDNLKEDRDNKKRSNMEASVERAKKNYNDAMDSGDKEKAQEWLARYKDYYKLTYGNELTPDMWSRDNAGKGDTNLTQYITQNNTIGADISKVGELIGKNLDKLVRSQLQIDVISSRVVRMGGV